MRLHYRPGLLECLIVVAWLMVAAQHALAAPVTLEWQLPTSNCGGDPQPIADELEFFVSTSPIPASDTSCPIDAGYAVDPRPAGGGIVLTAQTPNASTGSIDINLLGGQTYFVRARLRVGVEWSNLSLEVQRDVPAEVLEVPVIIRFGGD